MPPAVRTGDPTAHGGLIGGPPPGPALVTVPTVLIAGKPAAVTGSLHACPLHAQLGPANVILPGPGAAATGQVLIGGLPAARGRDLTTCGAMVLGGAPHVLIGGPL
ncbi:PAAR domain-containing protein [Streptomyces sp. URMC 123]|uniref:PAAR domain-containing protein n=1 Tax=Streptomyces sp. URMC 123 TaxID=3423403 RepID=UPI003F1D729E